ncbi:M-phase phosphoprotein 9 isoform X2 [Microcaecilia unicolor]|uniref:M-phase phosphoprotein 9 isoform X2 n=1 Tax=Microcaecilia unicolor TaxID=1415580 RepID=A0A6P7ZKL7_9AMPH|nr:M-phase phosphoprotein 9 isoform X2 [Microcaecilia unicolor]
MEDSDSVKSFEDPPQSRTEPDLESTVVCISQTGSVSQFPTNEASFPSGKTASSTTPGSAEVPSSFMQNMHNSEKTDSEIWLQCEARWLQLFRLVEKQCQDQIAAQQEQFHNQIRLIQDEIKHLVTLQHGNSPWSASTGESPKCTNNSSSLEIQTDQYSEACKDKGGSTSQLSSLNEVEKLPSAFVIQESFVDTTSLSSGYNTISATEPHPNLVTCGHSVTKQNMGCTESTLSELDGVPLFQDAPATIKNKSECLPVMEGNCMVLRTDEPNDIHFSQEKQEQRFDSDNDKVNKNHCGKMQYKSLTSWAQKMKQGQLKKAKLTEERYTSVVQENDQTEKLALDNSGYTDAFPAYDFYLRKTNDSPASVVSEDSGFTYWKLDEREMYKTLPQPFENVFSNQQFTKAATKQSKPSSLKDIYNRKQKESSELDDWNSPSQFYHHPPEVLTLDPTLHKKPSQQNPDLPPHPFNAVGSKIPTTPDSLLIPLSESHSDTVSFSHNSNIHSPLLDDSSAYSKSQMLHLDPWNNYTFQHQATATNSFPVPVSESITETLIQTDDEENSRNTSPSSMAQLELPCADCDLPDYRASLTSLEHPLMLSRIRQSLREKHARHIADLRDYYEAEIHNLKHQFDINMLSASEELKKTNQTLLDRCDQLERALTDASTQMQTVETKNSLLEIQMKDWRERFNAVSNTSKVLHERIEEMRTSHKEKDNTINRLKSNLGDLEAALQQSCRLSDDKDDRIKQECKMFQNLLMDYESLGKEHERVKDTLNTAENKLLDADSEISELKRITSKLEIQIKQVEHENITRLRQIAESHLWTSNSKPVHNPEVLQSPSKLRTAEVARRKWLIPGTDYSIFTGQPLESQVNVKDNRFEDAHVLNRYHTPPEKELSFESFLRNDTKNKDKEIPDIPIMKALKELEEKKVFKNWGTQTENDDASNKLLNRRQIGFVNSVCSSSEVSEKRRDQQKLKRFNSPSSQRSSSLPPSGRRTTATATPTKREIMLAPISMKHSPKRSPKENFSPGFNQI